MVGKLEIVAALKMTIFETMSSSSGVRTAGCPLAAMWSGR